MTRIIITWDGLEQVIGNLTSIEQKGQENIKSITRQLAKDTETMWKQATPQRTGRLQGGSSAPSEGMSFELLNSVHYYPFVDEGHMTPAGWRTKRGYRPAKRRSHVEGKHMTDKAVEFIEQNLEPRLSKFLDGV